MIIKFKEPVLVLLSAFRYALPRKSVIPSIVANEIIANWDELGNFYKTSIKNEIGEVIEDSHLDQCDIDCWSRILKL